MLIEYGASDDGHARSGGLAALVRELEGEDGRGGGAADDADDADDAAPPAATPPPPPPSPSVVPTAVVHKHATRLAAVRGRQGRLTPGGALTAGRRAAKQREAAAREQE
jgi:hypothetical protein